MSTWGSADAPASKSFKMRSVWLMTGSFLWIGVLVGLVALWRWDAAANSPLTGNPPMRPSLAVQQMAAGDSADRPAAKVITLPVSQNGDSQVIDLSALMNNGSPAPTTARWDETGVENFKFTNQDGKAVSKADLLGKPWVVCFVFTKCLGPCPTVTKQLRDLQLRLKNYDYNLVTLTVDPARDTPEVLRKYADLVGADLSNWHFLTGDQAEIYGLIHRSFKMPVQETFGPNRKEGFEIIHSTNVMLVDAKGVVREKFNAAKDAEMAQLRKELQSLATRTPVASLEDSEESLAEAPLADGR